MKLGLHVLQISAMLPPINNVRELLSDYFVPIYLGLRSTSRAEVIKSHTSVFARTLLDADADQAITIWNGTFINIQKSSSIAFSIKLIRVILQKTSKIHDVDFNRWANC